MYGGPQNYSAKWEQEVLAENFVTVTGPMTFTMNFQNPNPGFADILATPFASIIAPSFVMQHDLKLWSNPSNQYNLPYPTLSGNLTTQIQQYFLDLVATCNEGVTPAGCGTTYLDQGVQGSTAGTGPYVLTSFTPSSNDYVLTANPNYWGGAYQFMGGQKIVPRIQTIYINYVPSENTRELDLQSAAKSGKAMTADITATSLYDIVDRNAWLDNNTLISTIPGLTVYPPAPYQAVYYATFGENVTNPDTGLKYTFQPFADLRIRLAFADSVNMTEIVQDEANNLGTVATNSIPPGLPPAGAFDPSILPAYSYNLTAAQDLLVDAMMHPLTSFTQYNGTAAPPGMYNNTFGCPTLTNGQCAKPVPQTIQLAYIAGRGIDEAVEETMATAINNISSTYNMGLTVDILPEPAGALLTQAIENQLYMFEEFSQTTYPYVTGQLDTPLFLAQIDGWNYSVINNLTNEAFAAASANNESALLNYTHELNIYVNQAVELLYTYYPDQPWSGTAIAAITSNVQGYYYNPSINGIYYAGLY